MTYSRYDMPCKTVPILCHAQVILPAATGTYGASGGMYGGSFPPNPGSCTDTITGLPIPYSVVAQFPPIASTLNSSSIGISATTTLAEGTNPATEALPATSLYSVMVGTADLSAVVDTDVLSLTQGSTLPAAKQVLVADVSSATVLMMAATFITKVAPLLCLPSDNLGGTASPDQAAVMDLQVAAVAQAILSSAQLTPVYKAGSTTPSLRAAYPFDATNSADVLAVIHSAIITAGCSPTLMAQGQPLLKSATAVAQAAATVAQAATTQATLLAQLPIQLVLSLARLVYAAQNNVMPLFADSDNIGQYNIYLGPVINNASVLLAWQQAASINIDVALAAMGVTGGSAASATVEATAYGAGALQSCAVSYEGLLSLMPAKATTATTSGSFTMPNVMTGLVSSLGNARVL